MKKLKLVLKTIVPTLLLAVFAGACRPDPGPWTGDIHSHPTLICIRAHESDRNDAGGQGLHDQGYGANNGNHFGAYQFDMPTWGGVISRAGFPMLAMTPPLWAGANGEHYVDPYYQDVGAWQLLGERGTQPWAGSGC